MKAYTQPLRAGRPTANRVLRAAEGKGVVSLSRGRIEVRDTAALDRLAR